MQITIIGGSGFVGTRLTKRLLAAGHSVKIADKRRSVTYPELWVRCDIRNAGNETNEFPESLTYIGAGVFERSVHINEVIFPKNVQEMYGSIFKGC